MTDRITQPPAPPEARDDPAHTIEALNDQLQDQAIELDMLREALGVPYEPHQSLLERMLEAARGRAGAACTGADYREAGMEGNGTGGGMTDKYQPLRDAIAGPIIRSPRIAVRAAGSICVGDTRPVDTVEDLERGLHIEILGGENTEAEAQFVAAADPVTIAALLAENEALRAECERLRADAERYRFLAKRCRSTSEHWGGRWSVVIDGPAPASHNSEDDFDAAIDKAMEATNAG